MAIPTRKTVTSPDEILDEQSKELEYANQRQEDVFLPTLEEDQSELVTDDDFSELKQVEPIELSPVENGQDDNVFLDKPEPSEQIDYKAKKLKPFGKKTVKIQDKDLDSRNNTILLLKAFRLFVFLLLIGLFALGIKNTFFPERNYTNAEIQQIARETVGNTGFPMDKGRAFAQEFLKAFLNSKNEKAQRQILNRFYSGNINGEGTLVSRSFPGSPTNSTAYSDPILFEELAVTHNSAIFKFSAFLTNTDGQINKENGDLSGYWMSFSINVFYDRENNAVSLIEPPAVIPPYAIERPKTQPKARPLGTADNQIDSQMAPTVNGFLKAFANVSKYNHDEIVQYIPSSRPLELISGFGGSVKLAKGESSIYREPYKSTKENEWKVLVTVDWTNTQAIPQDTGMTYTSRYVLTVERTESGTFLVTKFVPYTFVEKIN